MLVKQYTSSNITITNTYIYKLFKHLLRIGKNRGLCIYYGPLDHGCYVVLVWKCCYTHVPGISGAVSFITIDEHRPCKRGFYLPHAKYASRWLFSQMICYLVMTGLTKWMMSTVPIHVYVTHLQMNTHTISCQKKTHYVLRILCQSRLAGNYCSEL